MTAYLQDGERGNFRMTALLGLAHQPDRRATRRHPVAIDAKIISREIWCELDCVIRNRSDNGAKLYFPLAVQLPNDFSLTIPSENRDIPVRLVWRRGPWLGVEFCDKAES
jgi:hypothetical protein